MTRTPISVRNQSSRRRVSSSNHARIVKKRAPLREELASPRHRRSSNLFRDLRDATLPANLSDDEQEDSHAQHPSYSWDDEHTLVAALMQDGYGADYPTDDTRKLGALADSLQEPFTRAGQDLLADMAHTLQPAVQRVTDAHRTLVRRVDAGFSTGLLAFDDACKRMEALALDEHDALTAAFADTEGKIKDLFSQLEEAYMHREQLWTDLDTVLAETVDPALEALKDVPAQTDRTIATLEKHARQLAAKDDSGADKIKGFLAKML